MIEEEKYLRETVGQRNAFRVPEGYFEHFAEQVMQQLPEEQKKSRFATLRPLFYAAACTAAALLMGVSYYWHHQEPSDDMVAESNYYEEVADYAMIDNIDIYACLEDN
jgi:hypothetical protein